jgi:small subunit ribosomal protein S16
VTFEGQTVWWSFGGRIRAAGFTDVLNSRSTMIKLRLKRFGKKREASFRLVACNSTSRRDGRPLQELGFYNPRTKETRLDTEAIRERLGQGAQPTDVVRTLLERGGLIEKTIRPAETVGKAKQAAKREEEAKQAAKEAAEAKAAAEAEAAAAAEASNAEDAPEAEAESSES